MEQELVRQLQPEAVVFSDVGPDIRWVGNEGGFANETCWATYQPVGENAYGLSAVTFTVGAEGKATRVVVENLDIHGQGTFTRVAHPV